MSDPSVGMGNLAEPECRRINAALALALERGIPCEWFAVSAGARIAMDSGTENMDWIALTLKRIVEFTQAGGELNIVIIGINVGAQPYWNAEATMLMHTRGILIMTQEAAMVLTGKQALDYSGGVSAEDNLGIGGYERIMGPNGQAQYGARDVLDAEVEGNVIHYQGREIRAEAHPIGIDVERFKGMAHDPPPRPTRSTGTSAPSRTAASTGPASTRSATSSPTRRTRDARSPSTSARSCGRSATRTTSRSSAGSR